MTLSRGAAAAERDGKPDLKHVDHLEGVESSVSIVGPETKPYKPPQTIKSNKKFDSNAPLCHQTTDMGCHLLAPYLPLYENAAKSSSFTQTS